MLHDVYCHLLRCVNEKSAAPLFPQPGGRGIATQWVRTVHLFSTGWPLGAAALGGAGASLKSAVSTRT